MILALVLSCVLAPQAPTPDLTKTFEPALAELVMRHRLPGLAIGVVKDGKIIYARGFGETSRGSGKPITTQSIFHMASVSKPFTATAAMQLVEAGKLDLDATITRYLPYFRLADEQSKAITIRQALTHTSGFPDVRDYEWDTPQYDAGAAERYVRSLTNEKLVFAPGKGSRYSNMAFDTMGDVIAKASGMSFDDYVRSNILEPLGMSDSSFIHSETPEHLRTKGHSLAFTKRIDLPPCPVYPYNRRHAPSSTLNSSIDDMCRWMLANLAGGELDGKRILATESYEQMWSDKDDSPQIGLSWSLDKFEGLLFVNHSGGDTGFNSFCGLLPEENLGVVAMVNAEISPVGDVARAALRAALGEEFTLPKPGASFEFAYLLENEGMEAAIDRYHELRETQQAEWKLDFTELDLVCGALMRNERFDEAVTVATLNADLYDEKAAAFARLGQTQALTGDEEAALDSFELALSINPRDASARAGMKALSK